MAYLGTVTIKNQPNVLRGSGYLSKFPLKYGISLSKTTIKIHFEWKLVWGIAIISPDKWIFWIPRWLAPLPFRLVQLSSRAGQGSGIHAWLVTDKVPSLPWAIPGCPGSPFFLGPQQPMEKWRFYTPNIWVVITSKNERNVGSHGFILLLVV